MTPSASLDQSANKFKMIDPIIVFAVFALCLGGLAAIYSATHSDAKAGGFLIKQSIGILLGLIPMFWIAFTDYASVIPRVSKWLYGINLGFLLFVAFRGHASHGAQRWIPLGAGIEFQPSESAKFILILCLAHFLYDRRDAITDWRTLLGSLVYISPPLLLILKQPDLGTALVVLSIWFGMVIIAGAKWQHLASAILIGALLFVAVWHTSLIKPYQKHRLTVFINPSDDALNTGYHLHQSEIAIGSGGFTGQGYLHGMQANGHFIPEQHTDFIFTIIGEEGGLVGACVILALYTLLLQRALALLIDSDDLLGRLLIAGVVSMFAFHIIVNIGMTIGVMPVTGVPLPFISYGLSSLVVGMASIGLILSAAARKDRNMFNL